WIESMCPHSYWSVMLTKYFVSFKGEAIGFGTKALPNETCGVQEYASPPVTINWIVLFAHISVSFVLVIVGKGNTSMITESLIKQPFSVVPVTNNFVDSKTVAKALPKDGSLNKFAGDHKYV